NEIETIGDLSGLDKLTSISVYNNKITDLNGLNGCAKLQTISAYDNNTLTGSLSLKNCPELTTLNVYITEVSDDTNTKDVVETTVKGKLDSIDVSGLKKLTNISAYNQALTSVNVKDCAALTGINLYGNQLTAIPVIEGCAKLTTITLNDNKITDIKNIATDMDSKKEGINTVVTSLNLSGNLIESLEGLKEATTLTTLNLAKNKITDISAIGALTTLKTLTLTDNAELASLKPISDNFATTSSLTLNIVGTKAAKDTEAIKEMQKKFSTMKITYTETTTEKK
ncbi:MAG: leucine-rich repeat domain-containing protein, partial [Clostridia bacterium]|nr:leucine-rich repeat domain-containing protein [Clostridia bacterium]